MTFFLGTADAPRDDIPTSTPPASTFSDRFSAAATLQRVEDDSWERKKRFGNTLAEQLIKQLPDDLRTSLDRPYGPYEMPVHRRAELFDALAKAKARDPQKFGRTPSGPDEFAFPTNEEEFTAIVNKRRQAEYDEAQSILAMAPEGSWGAEFAGRAWASLTEEKSLLSLALGAPARVGMMGTVLIEGALGGFQEAAMVGQRQDVADELKVQAPNPVRDIASAAVLAGALSGVIKGAGRLVGYAKTLSQVTRDMRPRDISPASHEGSIRAAQTGLENDKLAGSTSGTQSQKPLGASTLRMSDFDFSTAGNASPRTNRVGYVYGKLLEMGYEPHIAAGLTGNFMVESSPALHPNAVGDNGAALGIAQWNDRRPALIEFARKRGTSPDDLDTQIAFVDHELKGSEGAAWARIREAKTAEEAAALVSQFYERPGVPHLERRVGHARDVYAQFQGGSVPRYSGHLDLSGDAPRFGTSRGYTGEGQISTPSGTRIDVKYEVVDASLLRRASGDLQPRDRSRINSDAWIADTAARLDPAQLMPSPNAATGTPIIGPDNIIESGNGRVGAITRAYERFPDRAAAYRAAIEETTGAPIPEGVKEPVLVARRTSDLTDEGRRGFVVDAQDSGVARMTPTEIAQTSSRAMTPQLLNRLNLGEGLFHPSNSGFVRDALAALPASERNALFDGAGGLNKAGRERLAEAMFARAWNAPDILARRAETDGGDLKTLMDALDAAAPDWAALKADIEAGRVAPEADISPYILDAMRLIAAAREVTQKDGLAMAHAVAELLDDIDMLEGAVSPLTVALVKNKFWKNGKAASAAEIGDFLKRYASEARKVASTETMFAASTPEILRKIDPQVFGDLPDDIGAPRPVATGPQPADISPPMTETAYAKGADSPEAEMADQAGFEGLRGASSPDAHGDSADLAGPKSDPNNPKFIDTRATGERFHGSRSGELPDLLDEYTYSAGNIYGQGFYTTDAVAIANGYGKKAGGVVYRVDEIKPIHPFDMEQPIPDFLLAAAKQERGDLGGLVEDALYERPNSVRAFYDEIRGYSSSNGVSADDVQGLFDTFSELFRKEGFNALDHTGGLNTKKAPHQVRIYLDPRHDIEISKVDLTGYEKQPAVGRRTMRPGSDVAGSSPANRLQDQNSAAAREIQPSDDLSPALSQTRADFGTLTFRQADGSEVLVADLLDDIEADGELANVLHLCNVRGAA